MLKIKYILFAIFVFSMMSPVNFKAESDPKENKKTTTDSKENKIEPIIIQFKALNLLSTFFSSNRLNMIGEIQNKLVNFQTGQKISNHDDYHYVIHYNGQEYSLMELLKMKNADETKLKESLFEAIDVFWSIIFSYLYEAEGMKTLIILPMIKKWSEQRFAIFAEQKAKKCAEQKTKVCDDKRNRFSSSLLLDWAERGTSISSELKHLKSQITSFKELNHFVVDLYLFLGDMVHTVLYYQNKKTDL